MNKKLILLESIEDYVRPDTCIECGTRLTDSGECPKCDLGDEDIGRFDERFSRNSRYTKHLYEEDDISGDDFDVIDDEDGSTRTLTDKSKVKYSKDNKEVISSASPEEVMTQLDNASSYTEFVKILNKDRKSKAFLAYLRKHYNPNDNEIETVKKSGANTAIAVCSNLVPTQQNISLKKSLGMIEGKDVPWAVKIVKNPLQAFKDPTIVYAGKYIIDGHHRWSKAYALNGPDCKIKVINFPQIPGVTWKDMLKATQLAIVAKNPNVDLIHKVDNDNMLADTSGNNAAAYYKTHVDEKVVEAMKEQGYGEDVDAQATHIKNNVVAMVSDEKVSGAAPRAVMPQTDTAPGSLDLLRTGVIDLTENSMSRSERNTLNEGPRQWKQNHKNQKAIKQALALDKPGYTYLIPNDAGKYEVIPYDKYKELPDIEKANAIVVDRNQFYVRKGIEDYTKKYMKLTTSGNTVTKKAPTNKIIGDLHDYNFYVQEGEEVKKLSYGQYSMVHDDENITLVKVTDKKDREYDLADVKNRFADAPKKDETDDEQGAALSKKNAKSSKNLDFQKLQYYTSEKNPEKGISFDELKALQKKSEKLKYRFFTDGVDSERKRMDVLYDNPTFTKKVGISEELTESLSVDEIVEQLGGYDIVEDIIQEIRMNYPGISDVKEIADMSYDRVQDEVTYDDWCSIIEYLANDLDESLNEDFDDSEFINLDDVLSGMIDNADDTTIDRDIRIFNQVAKKLRTGNVKNVVVYVDSELMFDPTYFGGDYIRVSEKLTEYNVNGIPLIAEMRNGNLWLYFKSKSDAVDYLSYAQENI